MSVSQMRIFSAGRGGVERANWALQDSVLRLEEELMVTKSHLSKITIQLETLVLLVKRAWCGDNVARNEVARIVGVASPEFQVLDINGQTCVNILPKSRSVNNWAKLTIGLLKKDLKEQSTESNENQLLYLNQLQKYLKEQATPRRPLHRSQSNSSSDLSGQKQKTAIVSVLTSETEKVLQRRHRRPSFGHLYRTGSQKTNSKTFDEALSDVCSLTGVNAVEEFCVDLQCHYSDGRGDCRRYAMDGLFEIDDLSGDLRKRPPSGVLQMASNGPRQKSKAHARGERPLKYEITRPVSTSSKKAKSRLPSAKTSKEIPSTLKPNISDNNIKVEDVEESTEGKRNISPVSSLSECEEITEKVERPVITKTNKNTKKPESIIELDRDLQMMTRMQDDFRKKAMDLQRKLGIDENGMIF